MPETKEKNRYRERQTTEPQGFAKVVRTLVRVAECEGPIPVGTEATADETHDWREANQEGK